MKPTKTDQQPASASSDEAALCRLDAACSVVYGALALVMMFAAALITDNRPALMMTVLITGLAYVVQSLFVTLPTGAYNLTVGTLAGVWFVNFLYIVIGG